MNRIVREHYPVSNLPEDLRREFSGQSEVTLVISTSEGAKTSPTPMARGATDEAALAELRQTPIRGGDFSRFKHLRRNHFKSSQDVNSYLDALRNEWMHRER